ncbi:MAG: hypothetical protein Q9227_001851 [Pyrenula ochraceoflavens]
MSHTSIKSELSNHISTSLHYLQTNYPQIPLVLAEAGLELSHKGGLHNQLGQTLGAALWQVDWMLTAMTMGVSRVNLQSITGGHLSLWQPTLWYGAQPAVYPRYFASIFVAEFISSHVSGNVSAIEAAFESSAGEEEGKLSAYAAYEQGKVARVAVVNFEWWVDDTAAAAGDGDDEGRRMQGKRKGKKRAAGGEGRGSESVRFRVPEGVSQGTVKRLTSEDGARARADDMNFGGLRWSVESGGKGVPVSPGGTGGQGEVVKVDGDGWLTVQVRASEAVLVELC